MSELLSSFNDRIHSILGFKLRKYQEHVANEVIKALARGSGFTIVSMPTGSGKTLIEIFMAFYGLRHDVPRILVLEPTRLLCDQMYGLWSRVFGDLVGKEYEGNCSSFLEPGKRVVISTPQTALKCISTLEEEFRMVIIDEVHHAFGGKYYTELLMELKPEIIVGFTALLPSYKKHRLDPRVKSVVGEPYLLLYDFKKLKEIDPEFKPPKAIADMFDAEMNKEENTAYNALFKALPQGDPKITKFLELTLVRYGKEAFCESYKRAIERNKIIPYNDLDELCSSREPSHKARILADILTVYNIKANNGLRPVLVFTSRKATAYEFREIIISHLGFSDKEVAVLTSDIKKEDRLKLINKARSGEIHVIISTLVGEEGIDIPEAGLLVMMDVPKSPLRFYQRLGRLIRMSKDGKKDGEKHGRIKYLVISLTPKTVEYWDLEDALWNLYGEGVDVNYIVVNLAEKTPSSRVLDILKTVFTDYQRTSIIYSSSIWMGARKSPNLYHRVY